MTKKVLFLSLFGHFLTFLDTFWSLFVTFHDFNPARAATQRSWVALFSALFRAFPCSQGSRGLPWN